MGRSTATSDGPSGDDMRLICNGAFIVGERDVSTRDPKVKKALDTYGWLILEKRREITGEASTIWEKTNEWFNKSQKQSYLLNDPKAIELWKKAPHWSQKLLNIIREAENKPPCYPSDPPQTTAFPSDIVMVPMQDKSNHKYELNIPHQTSGINRELYLWGTTRTPGIDIKDDTIRSPTFAEIVAVVTARKIFE
jgi:hypothetical protein